MSEPKKTNGITKSLWFKILIGIVTFGLYFLLRKSEKKKSPVREWVDAILFAVIAATIIRTFFIEAYTIPTSSMEKSLLVGDFLFVSKVSYGARIPNTPLSFPFAHHTMPLTENTPAYLEWIKLPYMRLPGFSEIKNNDIVVFNYPLEDWRPTDKKENYIKRCVAIPGDKLEIKNTELFINDKPVEKPENMQFSYHVKFNDYKFGAKGIPEVSDNTQRIFDKMNITEVKPMSNQGDFEIMLTKENAESLKAFSNVVSFVAFVQKPGEYNPQEELFGASDKRKWNRDNYGPLIIPKEGVTVPISVADINLYRRIIENYEHNTLSVKDSTVYINGEPATSYTFKMDYYFMMGDNRHNSADSRFWGFVPVDHVVGKAVFIWLSLKEKSTSLFNKVRGERLFTFVSSDGLSRSFFWPVVLLIGAITGYNYFRRKKKKAAKQKPK